MATNNSEFFDALAALEKERGLPADYLIEKIVFIFEVKIKRALGDTRCFYNIVYRRYVYAFFEKKCVSRINHFYPFGKFFIVNTHLVTSSFS